MPNIAVIGCGAIGLTTALEIQEKLGNRCTVNIFADKFSPDTTSDVAAGLWEPYLLGDTPMKDVIKWSQSTYNYVLKLWKEGKAKEAGICLQTIINLFDDKNFTIPEWVHITVGHSVVTDRHLQSLSEQYKKQLTGGFVFTSFTWEAAIFLPYLQKKFLQNNGTITRKHIESFNELEKFDAIVNCAGFEARNLTKDPEVFPVRGQIMRAEAPWQHIMYLVQVNDEDSCYVIPNTNYVVLGGTKQHSFNTNINQDDSKRIFKNVQRIAPSFADTKIIKEVVGLRPSRIKVRLEEEFLKIPSGKILKIVHNYGHGGAGITLCVGCAKNAATLVEKIIQIDKSRL